jgi:hypothetical protein
VWRSPGADGVFEAADLGDEVGLFRAEGSGRFVDAGVSGCGQETADALFGSEAGEGSPDGGWEGVGPAVGAEDVAVAGAAPDADAAPDRGTADGTVHEQGHRRRPRRRSSPSRRIGAPTVKSGRLTERSHVQDVDSTLHIASTIVYRGLSLSGSPGDTRRRNGCEECAWEQVLTGQAHGADSAGDALRPAAVLCMRATSCPLGRLFAGDGSGRRMFCSVLSWSWWWP